MSIVLRVSGIVQEFIRSDDHDFEKAKLAFSDRLNDMGLDIRNIQVEVAKESWSLPEYIGKLVCSTTGELTDAVRNVFDNLYLFSGKKGTYCYETVFNLGNTLRDQYDDITGEITYTQAVEYIAKTLTSRLHLSDCTVYLENDPAISYTCMTDDSGKVLVPKTDEWMAGIAEGINVMKDMDWTWHHSLWNVPYKSNEL